MGNRTIYLPDELDELSRRLGLNLSRLTQQAIEAHMIEHADEALEANVAAASKRMADLGIDWPDDWLATSRRDSGER